MMSIAPAIASEAVFTSFSSEIYLAASFSSGSEICCSVMTAANGSNPFSFATVARVLRFGRYGR